MFEKAFDEVSMSTPKVYEQYKHFKEDHADIDDDK